MPPKAKFTREEIIAVAIEIVREQGIDAVTARELGKRLGSSARPVFTVFKNMDDVRQEIIKAAKEIYNQYVREGLKEEKAFRGVGSAYIKFSMKEPVLFKLLFMNEAVSAEDIIHLVPKIDENYKDILHSVQNPYNLSDDEAIRLYKHLGIYTHGIASMCATKVCSFTPEEISNMLTEVFLSLLHGVKEGKNVADQHKKEEEK